MSVYVMVRLKLVGPDEGRTANDEELRDAIESECAGIESFDVDSETHEDGTEVWTIDEAVVTNVTTVD